MTDLEVISLCSMRVLLNSNASLPGGTLRKNGVGPIFGGGQPPEDNNKDVSSHPLHGTSNQNEPGKSLSSPIPQEQQSTEASPKKSLWKRSVEGFKSFGHKFTSFSLFHKSVKNGLKEGKDDFKKAMNSESKGDVAKRIGAELLGVVVMILFLPFPGPSPAAFVSPTFRAFLKGFIKKIEHPQPSPPTDTQLKADEPSKNQRESSNGESAQTKSGTPPEKTEKKDSAA
ncbi:MAG: hypothetical protein K2X66_05175 [Cyanobacteria bacterium]|nr:hypothetical protein [Cyanobacteriota bacterium]